MDNGLVFVCVSTEPFFYHKNKLTSGIYRHAAYLSTGLPCGITQIKLFRFPGDVG
jgi:hypothetical protein